MTESNRIIIIRLSALGDVPAPWELTELPFVKHHLFRAQLKRYAATHDLPFRRFAERSAQVVGVHLQGLWKAVPMEWQNPSDVARIEAHLKSVRDNCAGFERGLREALV